MKIERRVLIERDDSGLDLWVPKGEGIIIAETENRFKVKLGGLIHNGSQKTGSMSVVLK